MESWRRNFGETHFFGSRFRHNKWPKELHLHTYSERDAHSVENRFRIFGAGSKTSLPSSKTILLRTNLKCFQKPSKELTEMHVVSFIRCSITKISVVYVLKRNFGKRISQ